MHIFAMRKPEVEQIMKHDASSAAWHCLPNRPRNGVHDWPKRETLYTIECMSDQQLWLPWQLLDSGVVAKSHLHLNNQICMHECREAVDTLLRLVTAH